MRVLSLGGGTQSTVMALLADEGRFGQRPDVAVFADTGWEPDAVYDNVGWLVQQLSYPAGPWGAAHSDIGQLGTLPWGGVLPTFVVILTSLAVSVFLRGGLFPHRTTSRHELIADRALHHTVPAG